MWEGVIDHADSEFYIFETRYRITILKNITLSNLNSIVLEANSIAVNAICALVQPHHGSTAAAARVGNDAMLRCPIENVAS